MSLINRVNDEQFPEFVYITEPFFFYFDSDEIIKYSVLRKQSLISQSATDDSEREEYINKNATQTGSSKKSSRAISKNPNSKKFKRNAAKRTISNPDIEQPKPTVETSNYHKPCTCEEINDEDGANRQCLDPRNTNQIETCGCANYYVDSKPLNENIESHLILSDHFLENSTENELWECGIECECDPEYCQNRLVHSSKGKIQVKLRIENTERKGYGVFSAHDILKGTHIGNYAGEVIILDNYNSRQENPAHDNDYLFLASHQKKEPMIVIDASEDGNATRFLNHDCKNFNVSTIYVMDDRRKVPAIALFACKDIKANEQLYLDYGENYWRIKNTQAEYCWCGTDECKYQKLVDLTKG